MPLDPKIPLDVQIEQWEKVGNIEYAVLSPDEALQDKGHIYIRGQISALKEFLFCFNYRLSLERISSLSQFKELETAEAEKRPTRFNDATIDFACERFFLYSRVDDDGKQIRPFPVADYYNRFHPNNFRDMQKCFERGIEKYRKYLAQTPPA